MATMAYLLIKLYFHMHGLSFSCATLPNDTSIEGNMLYSQMLHRMQSEVEHIIGHGQNMFLFGLGKMESVGTKRLQL